MGVILKDKRFSRCCFEIVFLLPLKEPPRQCVLYIPAALSRNFQAGER